MLNTKRPNITKKVYKNKCTVLGKSNGLELN